MKSKTPFNHRSNTKLSRAGYALISVICISVVICSILMPSIPPALRARYQTITEHHRIQLDILKQSVFEKTMIGLSENDKFEGLEAELVLEFPEKHLCTAKATVSKLDEFRVHISIVCTAVPQSNRDAPPSKHRTAMVEQEWIVPTSVFTHAPNPNLNEADLNLEKLP